jgi:hypothetical protein
MMNIEEAYKVMQNNCGIKIGDKVRVLRKAEDNEMGWSNGWCDFMDIYVGKVGKAMGSSLDYNGLSVKFDDGEWYYFPFFVLEKVEEDEGKKVMAMNEAYLEMQNSCGIKKGDKVRILRKAESYELGWDCNWVEEMDCYIGKSGEVSDTGSYGIGVSFVAANYAFPFFVLEKVEEDEGKKVMAMNEAYLEMQKNCGIKVDDKVRILRKAESYESGWGTVWNENMDRYIGKTGKVIGLDRLSGIDVEFYSSSWYFPFFVLEKVEEEYYCVGDVFEFDDGTEYGLALVDEKESGFLVVLINTKTFNRFSEPVIVKLTEHITTEEFEKLLSGYGKGKFKLIKKSLRRKEN